MPTYEVKTNFGTFEVDLNRPPNSREELMQAVESKIAGSGGQLKVSGPAEALATNLPPGAQVKPIPGPSDVLNKVFEGVGEMAGEPVRAGTMALTGSPDVSAGMGAAANAAAQVFGPGLIARGAQGLVKGITSALPGSQAGKMEGAIEKARTHLKFGTKKAEGEFLTRAGALEKVPKSDIVPLNRTQRTLNAVIADAESHGQTPGTTGFLNYAKDLRGRIAQQGGAPGVHWVDRELSQAGEMTKALKGGEGHPGFSKIFSAMAGDLENTAPQTVKFQPGSAKSIIGSEAVPPTLKTVEGSAGQLHGPAIKFKQTVEVPNPPRGTQTFSEVGYPVEKEVTPSGAGGLVRQKDIAYRRMAGWQDLTDEFEKLAKHKRGMAGAEDINANQLIDRLKQKEFLRESLTPEDWKDVQVIFSKIADMAALPPPRGAMFGAGRFAGTAGGVASPLTLMGVEPMTAAAIGGTTAALADISRLLLPSRIGRKLVRSVLESGPLDQNKINFLAQAARGIVSVSQGSLEKSQ